MDMNIALQLKHGRTVSWCSYFWSTVRAMSKVLWFAFLAVGTLLFASIFIFGVINMLAFLVTGVLGWPISWVNYELAVASVVLTVFFSLLAGVVQTLCGRMEFLPSYLKPKNTTLFKRKEPSFFYTTYKSWKDKVCPLVELEGGDE